MRRQRRRAYAPVPSGAIGYVPVESDAEAHIGSFGSRCRAVGPLPQKAVAMRADKSRVPWCARYMRCSCGVWHVSA